MDQSDQSPGSLEYGVAFRSVKLAKDLCLAAILIALLVELAVFCLVRFVGVLDPVESRWMASANETVGRSPSAALPGDPVSTAPTSASGSSSAPSPPASAPTTRVTVTKVVDTSQADPSAQHTL